MFWADIRNALLDMVFPPSVRARRVAAQRVEPLPLSLDERRMGRRKITVLSSYEHPRVRDAICALKFERDNTSRALLAALLDDYLIEYAADAAVFGDRLVCVPVPLGEKRLAERGMNQVGAIIQATDAVKNGRAECMNALVRTRETLMQSTLPRTERLANVRSAFALTPACRDSLRGMHILLIDDVTTTGATLAEAAKPLAAMGAKVELLALAG